MGQASSNLSLLSRKSNGVGRGGGGSFMSSTSSASVVSSRIFGGSCGGGQDLRKRLVGGKDRNKAKQKSSSGASSTADEVGFVLTSALSQQLIYQPQTSAHLAFSSYLNQQEAASKRSRGSKLSSCSGSKGADPEAASEEMPVLLYLRPQDVDNVRESWASVERQLVNVGVRVFINLLENQTNIRRTFRQYRSKRHSELHMNEDLQKVILFILSSLKKVVKYLNDNRALSKYLRRLTKKAPPADIDVARINPAQVASVFCCAVKEIVGRHNHADRDLWSPEVEDSWTTLFGSLLNACRDLLVRKTASRSGDGHLAGDPGVLMFKVSGGGGDATDLDDDEEEEEDAEAEEDEEETRFRGSHGGRGPLPPHHHTLATFDRHLVLVGCQTFQEFFDRHPEVLSHFDKFNAIEIDGVRVSDALRMHASRVLAIVEDIVDNTGNPDKIRSLMKDLGRNHFGQGITQEHLDMLGPIICQTIRPLVFKAGLWTIEVEKSWTHLFDMVATLMKRGYPDQEGEMGLSGFFPTLTHTLILKDTWALIVEQMHDLGLCTFIKLFRVNANLRYYYPKNTRPDSPDVQISMSRHFESLVSVIDDVVRSLPDIASHIDFLRRLGAMHCDVGTPPNLLELMGTVFCNSVRPLLLVQGKWSFKVESAWLLLFRHMASFMKSGYKSQADLI